jgi:probable F420-dependent oxidoreductase
MMSTHVQLSTGLRGFAVQDPDNWTDLVEFAQAADKAGFDRLVISEHVAFGENLEAYGDPANGGSLGGKQPTGPDGAWLDPIVTIAYLAALTSRVRFTTTILIAALRRPVVLAKTAATIDVLSQGRFDLGVGVGWQREEYEAAGLSFEGRGRLLNHTIEVCQTLWRNQVASYQSDELSFANIHQMPKPIQPGGVPIWVSGSVQPRSMDRLARYGSGWIPWGDDDADIEGGITRMRAAMVARGRDPKEIEVTGTLKSIRDDDGVLDLRRTMEPVPRLRDAGVTDFRLALLPRDKEGNLADFLGEAVATFHSVVT